MEIIQSFMQIYIYHFLVWNIFLHRNVSRYVYNSKYMTFANYNSTQIRKCKCNTKLHTYMVKWMFTYVYECMNACSYVCILYKCECVFDILLILWKQFIWHRLRFFITPFVRVCMYVDTLPNIHTSIAKWQAQRNTDWHKKYWLKNKCKKNQIYCIEIYWKMKCDELMQYLAIYLYSPYIGESFHVK